MKTAHAFEKRAKDLLKPITARFHNNNPIEAGVVSRARERYLLSYDVKMTHLLRLLSGAPISQDDLRRAAERLDPFKPYRSPISFYEIDRIGRSPRLVCNLPMSLKAVHGMARDLIEAQTRIHETVYGQRRQGRDHLVCDLRAALEGDPDAFLVLADVANCFQSINPDAIYNLGLLPEAFVEAALDVRQMRFRKKDRVKSRRGLQQGKNDPPLSYPVVTTLEHAGLRGLMQGSPASNSLLSAFFNDLHSRLPTGVTPFVISDNIAVVCRSDAECRMVCDTLGDYLSHHPAGPLVLSVEFSGEASQGFDFLGYTFEWINGNVSVRHSGRNFIKAMRRLIDQCDDCDLTSNDALATLLNGFGALTDDTIERFVGIIDEAC